MGQWARGMSVFLLAASIASVASARGRDADDRPQPTNGTFVKGPAIGGRDVFNRRGTVLTIFNEGGVGSMSGEPFTGSVKYTIVEERINFVREEGWFHAVMDITKPTGERIVVRLRGKTTGVDTTNSPPVHIPGTWEVEEGTGRYRDLHGHGVFSGLEQ